MADKNLSGKPLTIAQTGFNDVVVWNPGKAATENMQDMANNEYQNMLCVEAALIDNPISLNAGEEWTGFQMLESCSTNKNG